MLAVFVPGARRAANTIEYGDGLLADLDTALKWIVPSGSRLFRYANSSQSYKINVRLLGLYKRVKETKNNNTSMPIYYW